MENPLRKFVLALVAFVTGLFSGNPAVAATPEEASAVVTATAAAQAAPTPAKPALWKVSDEDTTIYLFGTVHILPEKISWFDGPVKQAFDSSDTLVTEIVEADSAEMQRLITSKAILPQGQKLRELLSEDQRKAYEAALSGFGMPAETFDRYEPWYVALILSTLPLMQEGFVRENGVEAALDAAARAREIPHEALETPEFQLGVFDGLPLDVQETYLSEVLEQLPNIRSELQQMVEAWRNGDPATLSKLMNDETSNPVLLKVLLTDRNKAWAEWVGTRMARPGTVFLAVGAGHLGGPGSLQELLGARDMRVERLQ